MKCSVCGATGPCWYNDARKLVCRACRDVEQNEKRDRDMTAKYVGKTGIWCKPSHMSPAQCMRENIPMYESVPVTVVGLQFGKIAWLIVRDGDGVKHRVKPHNVDVTKHEA